MVYVKARGVAGNLASSDGGRRDIARGACRDASGVDRTTHNTSNEQNHDCRHHREASRPGRPRLVPQEAPVAAWLPRPVRDHLLGPVGGQQLPLQRAKATVRACARFAQPAPLPKSIRPLNSLSRSRPRRCLTILRGVRRYSRFVIVRPGKKDGIQHSRVQPRQ